MDIPKEIRDAIDSEFMVHNAMAARWIYALSCSRMYRKRLMRNDATRIELDDRATRYARLLSSRELKGRAGYHAAAGNREECVVFVRAYLKQTRGYAS